MFLVAPIGLKKKHLQRESCIFLVGNVDTSYGFPSYRWNPSWVHSFLINVLAFNNFVSTII
jgi:hypothetical protein